MDWMNGEEDGEEEAVADGGPENDLGLGFDDDADGLDDEFDDGLDGDGFEDDEFDDGFDDGFDDDFGGGDVDGSVAELEDRVGELETQMSTVSSQMNTVREENKQIGETVNDLDDTIRKLLDIYEMVTRGINPFVDDAQAMGGLDTGGAFGLFEAEEEDEEDLDPDIANAEAESFFDDDFGDLDAAESEQEAEAAAGNELESEAAADPDPGDVVAEDQAMMEENEDVSSGASFEDLKTEYESGGWEEGDDAAADAETGATADSGSATGAEGAAETVDGADAVEDSSPGDSADTGDAPEADTGSPGSTNGELAAEGDVDRPGADPADDRAQADGPARESPRDAHAAPAGAREVTTDATMFNEETGPYLASLPASYVAELAALEWAQYLVDVGGTHGAMRAIRLYREYGWISRPVLATLDEYVMLVADDDEPVGEAELSVEHHTKSLSYVSRLAGDVTRGSDPRGARTQRSANGGSLRGLRR